MQRLSKDADGIMLHIIVIPLLRSLIRAGAMRIEQPIIRPQKILLKSDTLQLFSHTAR